MAWFSFTDASGESFAFRLTDADRIAEARNILTNPSFAATHVGGEVVSAPQRGNVGWNFHVDSDSVFFFEVSTEVGDSTMRYIAQHLDEVGGAFLPGSIWTGWSSRLTAELHVINGSADADAVRGTAKDDLVFAGAGDDVIGPSRGNDSIVCGTGNDIARGGKGDDMLDAGSGNDRLWGGTGRDVLVAGQGRDVLTGGAGGDLFIATGPDRAARTVITDFDPDQAGEHIQLSRDWLDGLTGSNGGGNITRASLLAAFQSADGNLIYESAAGAVLILRGLTIDSLAAGDFWLVD